jgi:hypothetical protein
VGKPGVEGVYTNQRLNLSKPWEGLRMTCQGFKPDSGNPTVRQLRPVKTGVFSRRQTCQGKSQEPCSLDGRMAGVSKIPKVLKPIDKVSLGEITSHRAVTTVNAMWPRKVRSEGRAHCRRAKAAWGAEIWPMRHFHLGGVKATAR